MFLFQLDEKVRSQVIFQWYLLSLNAGFINAGGFLATGRFVSHVTGFATLFGVDLVNHSNEAALGILSVPLFFLLGAFIAGILIDRPIHQGRKPHFEFVMGLAAICLFAVSFFGITHSFGEVGEIVRLKQVYVVLALLCLSCGLQNAAFTSSSGRTIRTTHLTGLTTDIGIGLARTLIYFEDRKKFRKEAFAEQVRLGSIISFVIGSAIGAWIFMHYQYAGFLIPALISSFAAWHGRKYKFTERILMPPDLNSEKS
jgi:uncharacterized membrane protein YoaK (UPF0700 family)